MTLQDAYSGLVGIVTEVRRDGGIELESHGMPWHLAAWERFHVIETQS
jgi:hypothetical protein